MTDSDRLEALRRPCQARVQLISCLTPSQAEQLARQDMQAYSAQIKQFERVRLREEMTLRAGANRHYKAAIDQAAMARLVEALQQTNTSPSCTRPPVGAEETCA